MANQVSRQFISHFDFKLVSPACHAGADTWSIKLCPDTDIGELLPYLNAELEGADYDQKIQVLLWKKGNIKYAFRPREISIAPVRDREEAPPLCEEIVRLINGIYARREEIEPDFSKIEMPSIMEIYKKLPRTNCGECGYPACMAFAAALRERHVQPEQCPHYSG